MTVVWSRWPVAPLLAASSVGVFWLVCAGILLLHLWHGWRQGVGRQMASVVGLVAGWIIGNTHGPAFLARFWSGSKANSYFAASLASLLLGIIVYALAVVAGRILFKRACDHSFGPTRIILGASGAFVAFFLGLFSVWLIIVTERLAGTVTMARIEAANATETGGPSGRKQSEAERQLRAAAQVPHSAAAGLILIQRSVENGLVGDLVRWTDPFARSTYTNLDKITRVAGDTALQERVWNAPELRDVFQAPKAAALRQDPSILDALQRHDYLSLASNPRLLAAANDPQVARRLERVDFTKVLNEAVP